jgi:hypothetical protein
MGRTAVIARYIQTSIPRTTAKPMTRAITQKIGSPPSCRFTIALARNDRIVLSAIG